MTRLNDGADLDIAFEEDFGIRRGEEGGLLSVKQRIPGTEKAIKCTPVTPGAREEYADVFEDPDADEERIAELWDDHIVEGIGTDADPAYIENLPYGIVAGVIQALKNSSGEAVFLAVREQVNEEMAGQLRMAENLSPEMVENLDAIMDSADGR